MLKLAILAGAVALSVALPALADTPTPESGPTESVPSDGPRVEVEVAGWLYSVEPNVLFQACVTYQATDFSMVLDRVRLFVLQPDGNFEATQEIPAQAVGPLDGVPQGECVSLDRLQP